MLSVSSDSQAVFDMVVNVGRCVAVLCVSCGGHVVTLFIGGVTMRMMLGSLSGLCTSCVGSV